MTRNAKGFTLAELLTSMVVMSIISLAVVSLTMALTTAQEYSEDFYRHVQIARNSLRYIERDINKAKLITAGNSDTLVYWIDTNGNGDIELTELRMITTDLETGEVFRCYAEFPAFWPQNWKDQWEADMTVEIATNLASVTSWIKNDSWYKRDELATEVTALKFTVSPAVPVAEMVQIELTVGEGVGAVELRISASMRSNKIADLYMDGHGVYFLAAPE
jgi:prepilin-type N-terminal cleavage/methylation domain-containing protein